MKVTSNTLQCVSTPYPTQYSVPKMSFKIDNIKENLTRMLLSYFLPQNKRNTVVILLDRWYKQTKLWNFLLLNAIMGNIRPRYCLVSDAHFGDRGVDSDLIFYNSEPTYLFRYDLTITVKTLYLTVKL